MLGPRITSRREAQGCPYCRELLEGSASSACAGCGTRLHDPCWAELPDCPTFGCLGLAPGQTPYSPCFFCSRRAAHSGGGGLRTGELWTCPGCKVQGHPSCWSARCPTPGCTRLPPEALPGPPRESAASYVLNTLITIIVAIFGLCCLLGALKDAFR